MFCSQLLLTQRIEGIGRLEFGHWIFLFFFVCLRLFGKKKRIGIFTFLLNAGTFYHYKFIAMSLFNTGKNKKDKKKNAPAGNKSMFIAPKGGGKANTKTASSAGKHVGGAQRGA